MDKGSLFCLTPPAAVLSDPGEAAAFGRLLLMHAQAAGCMDCDGHRHSPEERRVLAALRRHADATARMIPGLPPAAALELWEVHEMMHRVGYRRLPDQGLKEMCGRRAIGAWAAGDTAISEAAVYGLLAQKARNGRMAGAFRSLRDRWMRSLAAADSFPGVPPAESLRRLTIVIGEDLRHWFGPKAAAKTARLISANSAGDIAGMGSRELCCFRAFCIAAAPKAASLGVRLDGLELPILLELSRRPDISPYDREAFRLAYIWLKQELQAV